MKSNKIIIHETFDLFTNEKIYLIDDFKTGTSTRVKSLEEYNKRIGKVKFNFKKKKK